MIFGLMTEMKMRLDEHGEFEARTKRGEATK